MSNTRKLTAILLSAFAVLGAACNTVQGVGEDIESVGDAAERTGDKISGKN